MKIDTNHSDAAILAELGERLARTRLERNTSQAELAREAGVSKATVERLEAGDPVKSNNLIRVLRALGQIEILDRLLPEPLPSPVERMKLKGRRRQRAGKRLDEGERTAKPWRWLDQPREGRAE